MLLSTIQSVIILAFFPVLGLRISLPAIVGVIFVCAILAFALASFGIVLASFYESYESFSVIMNFIVMPMFFLSGAMYPVKLMPAVLQYFTKVNPLTFGVDALKHLIFPLEKGPMSPDFPFVLDLLAIIVSAAFFVTVGGKAFERKG